jgi:hypothetical protein
MAKAVIQNKTVQFWCEQIAIYDKGFQQWKDGGDKIVKRYKNNKKGANNTKSGFNILWSNVQTLAPALYAKPPIPNVDRRFEDEDKVGTTAARVLERAVSYYVDADLFDSVMSQVVKDRLLPGRGVSWVRYVPNFKDPKVEGNEDVKKEGPEVTDDTVKGSESDIPELYAEDVVADYVHWKDFGHTWARTWEEVRGVWRIVYMSREEMKKRGFPDWKDIPLEKEKEDTEEKQGEAKAIIYEIWDKVKKEAIWLHKGMEKEQDRRPDPLGLKDFFPCPKPLYATLANDNLIPTPDFRQYEDQARELDDITNRIASIQKSLKVIGVYDASAQALDRLLSEGNDNTMIPVEQWAVFGEKGGLKGAVDFFPLDMVAAVLVQLYEVREKVKQDLYEITGISDIIRGATDPNETLGAQELKGKFATLRMDNEQKDVARFSRDLVRIFAEIIAEHFSLETIKQICGIKLMTGAEKQQAQAQLKQAAAMAQQTGQEPPPMPEGLEELLDSPTWEEVDALLRDDIQRCFRISIETDSTIKQDQEAEKAARIELVGQVGAYLEKAALLPPTLQPLAAELLQFGVKGFKISRELETTFDLALKKLAKQAEAPPQPDPEQMKVEADMKNDEDQRGLERDKMGQEKYLADQNFALEQEKLGVEKAKIKADVDKTRIDAKTKVSPDVAMSDNELQDEGPSPMERIMAQFAQMMLQGFQQIAQQQAQGNQAVIQAIAAPRTTEIVRDNQGRIAAGVSTVQ